MRSVFERSIEALPYEQPFESSLVRSDAFATVSHRMLKKTLMVLCMAVLAMAGQLATGAELLLDFRSEKTGELPRGFRPALAGSGTPGDWKIVEAVGPSLFAPLLPTAPRGGTQGVLAQLSTDPADERFPMLIYTNDIFGDFSLTTKFKLVSGEKEQMAGIAFRIQDEKNFYYVRASALGGTFNFFKIVNGVRSDPIGIKVVIAKDAWHEMIVECKGTSIRAALDGRAAIPTLDDKSFSSAASGFGPSRTRSLISPTRSFVTSRARRWRSCW